MTITEMRNKRAKLWNTMEGFLDTHRNVLSAEDDATYSKMEHDLDSLTNEIKRMERRDAIEAELNKPVNQPITEAPERAASLKHDRVGRASDAYKEDFDRHLRGKALVHNVLSEGVDADGGYLVPEEFERDIVTALEEENVIRSLANAMTAELSVELAEATLYADDGAAEVVKEFQSGTLTLGVDNIGLSVAADLTGATIDNNNVLVSTSEDGGDPVAIGFRAKKANGKYRYFWLYRVIFSIPATNLTTKGESIEFSTPSIEGTVLRRNKLDGQGKHPWKAEVSEDSTGVSASVISGWYTEVYEPTFAQV